MLYARNIGVCGGHLSVSESNHLKLLDLAIVSEQLGAYGESEGLLNDAIAEASKRGTPSDCSLCYGHLALFLERRGRTDESKNIRNLASVLDSHREP